MGSTDSAPGSAAESGSSAGFRKMHDFDVQFSLGTLRAVREGQSNPGQLTRSPFIGLNLPFHPSSSVVHCPRHFSPRFRERRRSSTSAHAAFRVPVARSAFCLSLGVDDRLRLHAEAGDTGQQFLMTR